MATRSDSLALVASLSAYLATIGMDQRLRGMALVRSGDVARLEIHPDEVPYTVFGTIRDGGRTRLCTLVHDAAVGWAGVCDCAARQPCTHLYAAGAALRTKLLAPESPAALRQSFRERWTPELQKMLGRPLTVAEGRRLDELAALHQALISAGGSLSGRDFVRMGFASPEAERSAYRPAFEGWWSQPPPDPWSLWQYVAYDLERTGRPIPELFRPMTATLPIRAALEANLVRQDTRWWTERLNALELTRLTIPAPAPSAPQIRLRLGPDGWRLEAKTGPAGTFKPASRKLVKELRQLGIRNCAHLPPAQVALASIVMSEVIPFGSQWSANQPAPEEAVTTALQLPSVRDALAGPDGGPWKVEDGPLTWQGRVDAKDPTRVTMELVDAAGTPVPGARLAAEAPERLYVAGNRVYRGPAALPASSLPVAVAADPDIAARLRRAGVKLPETLSPRFEMVPMHPAVECWVDPGTGYGMPMLCLRLRAESPPPRCAQVWTGRGWQWENGETPRPGRAGAVLEFDLSAANAVGARFSELRLHWNYAAEAWTRPLGADFPEAFLAWRDRLPADVTVMGKGELKGLFEPALRLRWAADASPIEGLIDWFDVRLNLRADDLKLTETELEILRTASGPFVRLGRKGWRRIETEPPGSLEKLIDPDRLGSGGDALRLHALQLADESLRPALPEDVWELASRRAGELRAIDPPAAPRGLKAQLRPYQLEGFHFLAFLSVNGFGGILADDMGLGKTVQALAWLQWLADRRPKGSAFRALVVCPKSVMVNWELEAARFVPGLKASRLRPNEPEEERTPARARILVANYTQLRLRAEALGAEQWDAVVLDEGQNIKNPGSATAKAARALRTANRLVLTGTPIENRLLDLWSLFAFAMPGLLGSQAAFGRLYDDRTEPAQARARLAARVRHFLLRRTKGQVAPELPPRIEDDLYCELEGQQAELYQAELKRARQMVLAVEGPKEFDRQRFNILQSLLRLRQICCDPRLIGAEGPGGTPPPSAKLEALFDALEPVLAEGAKVLIFSQFVTMLDLIAADLTSRGVPFLKLTGQTENRQELVDRFQTDAAVPVFLLSLKAAGSGLNLTAASYVVLYDPWWNPAVEAQAIDRTHRIGQASRVIAYRLLARGTVEEKIRALQKGKSEMAAAVVREESLAQVMDLETLRQVLS